MSMEYLFEDSVEAQNAPGASVSLDRLKTLCAEWQRRKEEVERLEELLSEAKQRFNKVSQEALPEFLAQSGLSEVKLDDGSKVKVTQEVSPTITDMAEFVQFLADRGESAIVKTDFSLGKVDASIVSSLQRVLAEKLGLYPEVKNTIHPATLKKYVKEVCGLGQETVPEGCLSLQDLPPCLKVYTYFKTDIKAPAQRAASTARARRAPRTGEGY